MKRAFLIGSIVIATATYGQGMSGQDSQNGQVLRGQQDGNGHNGGRDNGRGGNNNGRGGRDDGRGGRDDGRGGRDDGRGGRDDGRGGRDDGRGGRDDGRGGRDDGRGGHDDGRGGRDDGRGGHGGGNGGGYEPPRPPNYPPQPPHYPPVGPALCEAYVPQMACTGRDLAVWMPPYVNYRTSGYDCMQLCNRRLYEMNWTGYACCQFQTNPNYPVNCILRDGMPMRGGNSVGASSCNPTRRY